MTNCMADLLVEAFRGYQGLLALADSDEPRHQEAVLCYRERARLTGRILTSNFVLDEFLTILFPRRPFAEAERFTKALSDLHW